MHNFFITVQKFKINAGKKYRQNEWKILGILNFPDFTKSILTIANPTRRIAVKKMNAKINIWISYRTRTKTWMFCPRSGLVGFLGVADIFALDFRT